MGTYDIAFPNLGIYLTNVPKTFTVFGFDIAVYGNTMACAIMAGILMAAHVAKKTGQDPDLYWDAAIYLVIFSFIGARIYYVAFMWDYYKDNPLQIMNFRGGGIAMYGGVLGAIVTSYVYCRIRKISQWKLLDTCAYGLVLGQVIGRWGNFFNREVFGEYTNSLFAMQIPAEMVRPMDISEKIAAHMTDGTILVHPTFLYEGVWNAALLIVMFLFLRKKKFHGEIWLLYLGGYGIGRAIVEAIRTDQLYLPHTKIPVSLCLGVVMAVVSVLIDAAVRGRIRSGAMQEIGPDDPWKTGRPETRAEAAGPAKEPTAAEETAAAEEPEEKPAAEAEQENIEPSGDGAK